MTARLRCAAIAACVVGLGCGTPQRPVPSAAPHPANPERGVSIEIAGVAIEIDARPEDSCVVYAESPLSALPLCGADERFDEEQVEKSREDGVRYVIRRHAPLRMLVLGVEPQAMPKDADLDFFAREVGPKDGKLDRARSHTLSTSAGRGWLGVFDDARSKEHFAIVAVQTANGLVQAAWVSNADGARAIDEEAERASAHVRTVAMPLSLAHTITVKRHGIAIDLEIPPDTCRLVAVEPRTEIPPCNTGDRVTREEIEEMERMGMFLQLLRRGAHPSSILSMHLRGQANPTDWDAFTRGMKRSHDKKGASRLVRNDARSHIVTTKAGAGWFGVFDEDPPTPFGHRAMIVLPTPSGPISFSWIGSAAEAQSLEAEAERALATVRPAP
jgi:hypothetical protein